MREQIRDEIKEMAPNLAEMKKSNPYRVPEGYFDSLPTLIQEKISAENPVNPLYEWLREVLRPRVAVPAMVLMLAVGSAWYFDNQNTGQAGSADYLSYDYISNSVYFDDFEDDILFEELLAENGLDNIDDEAIFSNLDIENYLMNSQLNESVILNEL